MEAALHCFVERGFHGTAVPQIARSAGISAGTIYHYFDSKEALVNALYRKWKTEVAQRVFTAFPQDAEVRAQFSVMWRELVAFAVAHPAAFAFLEFHDHVSYLDAESLAAERALQDFASAMVQRSQGEGVLKSMSSSVLIELVFGAFNGMMRAHWEGRLEMSPDVIGATENACWDMIAVRRSPSTAPSMFTSRGALRSPRDR